jgi:sterol desaturase/sphingolipid hydroxylase (fatty acid hydroxylase superfamily)
MDHKVTIWQLINDYRPFSYWLLALVISGIAVGIATGYFRARKIQPNGFRWKIFRNEIGFAIITVAVSATVLGYITKTLTDKGIIAVNNEAGSWWVVLLEYVAYFFLFDTYFYWLHRWMHSEPIYTWVHKIHHRSTSPNLLTTLSVSPLESIINGGFVAIFTSALTVHASTMALILPTNIVMGLYVHAGYEFFPRWWNKSWATKWFITTTFHDHHHKYFKFNFGGYTTIWDWLCGTVRPNFIADFEKIKDRAQQPKKQPSVVTAMSKVEG